MIAIKEKMIANQISWADIANGIATLLATGVIVYSWTFESTAAISVLRNLAIITTFTFYVMWQHYDNLKNPTEEQLRKDFMSYTGMWISGMFAAVMFAGT